MGLVWLIAGLVLFAGGHLVSAARDLRGRLIAALGAMPFKIIYSIVAFAGVILMGYGFARYRSEGWIDIWMPPAGLRHLSHLLILIAMILMVASYARGHIYRRVKHPLLAGTKLWALAHLLVNGDLASVILFGGLLAWAVVDLILINKMEPAWQRPGAGPVVNDVLYIALSVLLFGVIGYVHIWLGYNPFG